MTECGRRCADVGSLYEAGPTACVAHPDVVRNIKSQISLGRVLSAADARLATLAGMLDIPSVGRSGFNDGVIYPPTDAGAGPALAAAARPSRRMAMRSPSAKTTLNCLVLLVDFPDNVGAKTPADYQHLLFDVSNKDSMAQFYNQMSYGKLTVTGVVTSWIRAKNPYKYYTDGQSGTGNNHREILRD